MSLKSEELFNKMSPMLETVGKDLVAKVGAVFHFDIKKDKDSESHWFSLDLKNGNGKDFVMQASTPRERKALPTQPS
jgi:hypothetical protein